VTEESETALPLAPTQKGFDECFEHNDHLRANGHLVGELALQPPKTGLILYWKNAKSRQPTALCGNQGTTRRPSNP